MSACGLVVATATSPTRSPRRIIIPSSPDLPSPTALLGPREKPSSPDSRQKPSEGGFGSSFETASSLLRREVAAAAAAGPAQLKLPTQVKNSSRERDTTPVEGTNWPEEDARPSGLAKKGVDTSKPQKRHRKGQDECRNGADEATATSGTGRKDMAAKKPAKQIVPTQSTIGKAKITKPFGAENPQSICDKSTERATAAAAIVSKSTVTTIDATDDHDESLGLAKAVARRRGWTPTKNADKPRATELMNQDLRKDQEASSQHEDASQPAYRASFSVTKFSFESEQGGAQTAVGPYSLPEAPALKKRRLELVGSVHIPSKTAKPSKSKSPKKKPATITEQAIRPYNLPESPKEASLLQYFQSQDRPGQFVGSGRDEHDGKTSAKSTKRPKKTCASTKLQPCQSMKPPGEALKILEDQSFAFGTSSQLVNGSSAGLDLRTDENTPSTLLALSSVTESGANALCIGKHAGSLGFQGTKSLWSAAARDTEGSLLDNKVYEIPPTDAADPFAIEDSLIDLRKMGPEALTQAGFMEIEDIENMEDVISRSPSAQEAVESEAPAKKLERQRPVQKTATEATLRKRSKRDLAPQATKTDAPVKRRSTAKKQQDLCGDRSETMPDFKSYRKRDLEYALKSLSFKPIKSQQLMIETLEKCWEDKRRLVLESVDSNKQVSRKDIAKKDEPVASPSKSGAAAEQEVPTAEGDPAEPPRRKRGRPRKTVEPGGESTPRAAKKATKRKPSKAEKAETNETNVTTLAEDAAAVEQASIADVTPLHTTTIPCNTLATIGRTDSAALDTQASAEVVSAPDEKQTYLLQKITEAIEKQPPTHDAASPSWREKILMYDPVILEDLAQWLNVAGLGAVSCDDEVWPGLVREWCAARSIVCVWRMSLRGVARSRF